jgi:2-succinyl-6-hydroxy-2,4-cyclohexadiene-1-carboxylate synthase
MRLALHRWGDGPVALLWLHGFTGDGRALDHLAPATGHAFSATCPDLPGHGATAAPPPAPAGWEDTLAALERVLETLPRPRVLAGYSQGARLALGLALRAGGALDGLLLESAAPGLADPDERRRRVAEDEDLATLLEVDGLEAFLARWRAHPVLAGLTTLPAPLADELAARRRRHDPRGLAAALRAFGQGVQPVLRPRPVGVPALLLCGARDAKYTALARALAPALGAELRVADCGHAPHLEAPAVVAAALLDLHRRVTPASTPRELNR